MKKMLNSLEGYNYKKPDSIGDIVSVWSSISEKNIRVFEWILFIILPIVGWFILIIRLIQPRFCIFVGNRGFSFYRILKKEKELIMESQFIYEEFTDLIFSETRQLDGNNNYTKTEYSFKFINNNEYFLIEDEYEEDKKGLPKFYNIYKINALKEIERIWTNIKLPILLSEHKQNGYVKFTSVNDVIELGGDYIKVNNVKLMRLDIKEISISDGEFIIATNKSSDSIFKSNYKIRFDINKISNQKCFFEIFNQIKNNLL